MIRSLKILGEFSLAQFNRGVPHSNPDIETLLKVTPEAAEDKVSYEDIYFKSLSEQTGSLEQLLEEKSVKVEIPFKEYLVHDREGNILFR